MKRRIAWIAACVLVVAVAVIWRLPDAAPPDEEQITGIILDVKTAVETKDPGGILKHISDDYSDGTYNKRDITRMVMGGFRQPEPFSVHVEPPQVTVQGSQAFARVRARFATGPRANPSSEVELDVRVVFAKNRGRWRVTKATGWEPATDVY